MSDKWDRRFLELAKHISDWSKDPSTKVGCIVVGEDRDHYYFSIVKILERKGDRLYLWWGDGYCEEGWFDLDWLTARVLGVRS